jgi:hypothetical protein
MELTESEKKGLRRFSLLLESLSDTPWQLRIWFSDNDIESLHHNKFFHNYHASGNVEIDLFMEAFLDNFLRKIKNDEMIFDECDEDYCRGYINFEIDPKEKKFVLSFDFEVDVTDNHKTNYSFSEFLDLNDDEIQLIKTFVQEDKDHLINFDGGGDSGYIENKDDRTGEEIPAFIYDMLYEILESDFGGWEINNGSHGHFEVDYENEEIHCSISIYDTNFNEEIIETYSF